MKRLVAIFGIVAFIVTSCGNVADRSQRGPAIDCDSTSRGRLLLFAQAVPTAEAIPCLRELPAGWDLLDIETSSDRARIDFANDTYDVEVQVTFLQACDAPEEESMTLTTSAGFPAYVFAGGCLAFEPHAALAPTVLSGLVDAFGFLTRDELRSLSGWEL